MAPKPPGYIAAKAIDEREMLAACADYETGSPHPTEVLPYPPNVVRAKQKKLEKRGLVKGWKLTHKGREVLCGL
jgi:hypothetical protein